MLKKKLSVFAGVTAIVFGLTGVAVAGPCNDPDTGVPNNGVVIVIADPSAPVPPNCVADFIGGQPVLVCDGPPELPTDGEICEVRDSNNGPNDSGGTPAQ